MNENKKVIKEEVNIGIGTEIKVIKNLWIRSSILYLIYRDESNILNNISPLSASIGIFYIKQ